jgi:hypothetical protein
MRRTLAGVAVATVIAGAVGISLAPAAQAYDRDAYAYAAAHMIERSDIPAALGPFKPALSFNANVPQYAGFLCPVPTADPSAAAANVRFPSGRYNFNASYTSPGKDDSPWAQVSVYQFTTAKKAIAAWEKLTTNITRCTGTGSNTWTNDDGSTTTYSTEVTHGVVPMDTTTGVESVFVSQNSLDQSTPGDSRYVNDSYSVYSLVDDVIIQTQFYANNNGNLTTKQRKAVNRLAFNAETRWLAS